MANSEVIEYQLKSISRSRILAILLAFGSFYNGYCSAIFNPMAKIVLQRVYNIDPEKDKATMDSMTGLINAVFAIGAMVGVFSVGMVANKIGRKPLVYASEIVGMSVCILYFIQSLEIMILARFISGIVAGMSSIGGIIISELLPNRISGFGNGCGYVIGTFAMLCGYATQNVMSQDTLFKYWKEIICITVVTSASRIMILPMFLKSDTPKYIYNSTKSEDEIYNKIKNCYKHIYSFEDVDRATFEAIKTFNQQKQAARKVGFEELFTPRFIKRTFAGCFLAFAQQICGINFFIFYSNRIFDKISGNGAQMTLVIGISNFTAGFLALDLIERLGRKFNFVFGSLIQSLSLALLLIGVGLEVFAITAAAACIYIMSFAVGLGSSYGAYMNESLPPVGVGLAVAIQWIFTALIGYLTPILDDSFGEINILTFFAVVCLILFFVLAKITIETKGKKEYQIDEKFAKGELKWFDFS
jgi:MFS transporter, SP family, galactose:H+ symporter